jgi:leucyl-tRNA synthetase
MSSDTIGNVEQTSDRYGQAIDQKWQRRWAEAQIYRMSEDATRPKHYALTMLPYPSGRIHIGHAYAMMPSDTRARFMRMRGYNVFFPMGFDAFGLPAENAAIQRGIPPKEWTYSNIDHMRGQLQQMGMMIDWNQEAISSDPKYYKWTQWFFTQLYKHGLAYRTFAPVDWCPKDNTTLAREQVVGEDRRCERCGTPVIKKPLDQWLFRITNYADELLDFSGIDWPERVMTMQRNWIGRSEGAQVVFRSERGDELPVFTTRPDTLWGATFMVLAPEHPLVAELASEAQRAVVDEYVKQATRKSEIERAAEDKEKTGVFLGAYATNPVNDERIPIWIADYVMLGYGTGAIMAVPAHDQRDFEFATKYALPIVPVISWPGSDAAPDAFEAAYTGEGGVMVNSGPLNGVRAGKGEGESVKAAIAWLEAQHKGVGAVNYRLRDWLISRQRYWGAPIPIVYCQQCGEQPVPDEQLPVLLPDDVEWRPTGESPLKLHPTWRFTTCPSCGGPAERDTDTMDTFMCSSWYQYRYLSPDDDAAPFDPQVGAYWLPVDMYTGGIEHATLHLMYTRFFTKAMRDMGIVAFDEPMTALRNQGIILGEDSEKMSKSRGNVVDPDELLARYGSDAVRTFLMSIGPWDQGGPWASRGIEGMSRYLNRLWTVVTSVAPAGAPAPTDEEQRELRRLVHQTIRKVTEDTGDFRFNTALAAMITLVNAMMKSRETGLPATAAWAEAAEALLLLMAPYAPHLAEELWAQLGKSFSIHQQAWPSWDEALAADESVDVVLQVNGKVRDKLSVPVGLDAAALEQLALASDRVRAHLGEKPPRKVIVVPGKLVNVVV